MALGIVREILVKAATDPSFRARLFDQTDLVLSQYELTNEEKQCMKELDEETLSKAMRIESSEGLVYSNDIRI